MKRKAVKKRVVILSFIVLFLLSVIGYIAWGNTALELNSYKLSHEDLPEGFSGFRIAHVSDLHNAEIGENNGRLIEILKNATPDIIVITGDLVDSRRTNINVALEFAEQAMRIAPCYYVTGNHESRMDEYDELKDGLETIGVEVLENECIELEYNGDKITLLGIHDPLFNVDDAYSLEELMKETCSFTLLLAHRPEKFEYYADCDVDLVLSGHVHGGQFRLPILGGVYVPNQGFFPKYDAGLYTEENTNMIISRGIGNSAFPFRINNRPEVILIELESKR